MKNKILIIGRIPPPIGGVTIHVQRLLDHLNYHEIPYQFQLLEIANFHNILKGIVFHKNIHLHSSNPFIKILLTILSFLFRKNLIVTNHGDLGRYNNYKDILDNMTIKLAKFPIVLNEQSFNKAIHINKNTKLISSFLPPIEPGELSGEIMSFISSMHSKYKIICSTNASAYNFDSQGNEIYGIEVLINEFSKTGDIALIISDPSGQYSNKFKNKKPHNVKFIIGSHSYYEILKLVDVSIRNTTTDGDALSIKESLYLNKVTLASDCVSRPPGVVLFSKFNINLIYSSYVGLKYRSECKVDNAFDELKKLYNYHK